MNPFLITARWYFLSELTAIVVYLIPSLRVLIVYNSFAWPTKISIDLNCSSKVPQNVIVNNVSLLLYIGRSIGSSKSACESV